MKGLDISSQEASFGEKAFASQTCATLTSVCYRTPSPPPGRLQEQLGGGGRLGRASAAGTRSTVTSPGTILQNVSL